MEKEIKKAVESTEKLTVELTEIFGPSAEEWTKPIFVMLSNEAGKIQKTPAQAAKEQKEEEKAVAKVIAAAKKESEERKFRRAGKVSITEDASEAEVDLV